MQLRKKDRHEPLISFSIKIKSLWIVAKKHNNQNLFRQVQPTHCKLLKFDQV